jgi:hypothetical protein
MAEMWDIRRQKCIFNLQGKKRKRTGNLNFQHIQPKHHVSINQLGGLFTAQIVQSRSSDDPFDPVSVKNEAIYI